MSGLNPQADQDGRRDRHGRAETGRPFEERAERERDEQELKPAVLRDAGQALPKNLEIAPFIRQIVEIDNV